MRPAPRRPGKSWTWSVRRAPEVHPGSELPDGEDGDVVAQGGGGELSRPLEERLAQDLGLDARVTTNGAGDAVFAEQLLARPGLGQPVGVHEDEVARVQLHL